MISREEAIGMLEENISAENMRKHCYASEAVLRAIARRLGHNEEEWGIAGLLHDIDVEITQADPFTHGPYAEKLLIGKVTPEMLNAIVMHNEIATGKERTTEFQHALAAGETITGKLTQAPGNHADIGGLKVVTENGWFAARPSGTEDIYK
ncbi:MAG: hypothetical protein EOM73_17280, partial [Bacteroidia bacterium]|nr:hypothetical protein [Bacteroidia bacterium]